MKSQNNHRAAGRSVTLAAGALPWFALAFVYVVVSTAPTSAQQGCAWYGTPPLCNGKCPVGAVYTGQRDACVTGSRVYCCPQRYLSSGINCKWVGRPGNMSNVCDEAFLKFFLKNECNATVEFKVEYEPVNSAAWATKNYRFSPGQVGYLVETKNRFIYVTAHSMDGKKVWPREKVDMGGKLGKKYTYALNCR